MNLVDENNRPSAVLPRPFGFSHDLFNFFDSREHGREFNELRFGHVGDDLRQRRLSSPGWSPEDERAGIVAVDLHAQRLDRSDQMLLPDKFIERSRTHAIGQWTGSISTSRIRNGLEQAHKLNPGFSLTYQEIEYRDCGT